MYAIYFRNNICVKCGKENSIKTIDSNNTPISAESGGVIKRAICNVCSANYILQWNNSVFYPVDKNNINKFVDNFNN